MYGCPSSGGVHLVVLCVVLVNGGVLVLLVLGDQVVHVGLRLGELHLVHALATNATIVVKESLCITVVNDVNV